MTNTNVTYKPKRLITVPVLSLKENEERILRFESDMHVGKTMKVKEGEKAKEPAIIARVTDMVSGEIFELIVNAVLRSVLDEEFPEGGYVKKVFSITALPKREGKQYKGVKVYELEAIELTPPKVKEVK